MTQLSATSFLERYAEAFARFDADAIADHLDVPLTVMNPEGATVLTSRNQLIRNFASVNEQHRQLGFHQAILESCRVLSAPSPEITLLAARWRFVRRDESTIHEFPITYVVREAGNTRTPLISVAINVAAA